jgi:predicted nucleotidyltransferase
MKAPLLLLLATAVSAQTRVMTPSLRAGGAPVASVPVLAAPSLTAPALAAPAFAALSAPPAAALPALAAPAAAPAALVAPALAGPAALAAASSPERPADPAAQLRAISEAAAPADADRLWTGAVPASEAKRGLYRSYWGTFKFFMGSRSALLHSMVRQQQAETRGKPRAVKDLEGMWLDWRTKAYAGTIKTAGFQVADRATIRREAVRLWDKYFPKDAVARAAFHAYLDRVDRVVPLERPSYYRKKAFGVFYELPTAHPAELAGRIEAMLTDEHLAKIAAHRAGRQQEVLASFKAATVEAIRDANQALPQGRKIVAMALLGSYAIGQSGPTSDIDYQLITQDGGTSAIKPFAEALDRRWTENRLKDVEGFASTLPPSPEVVRESFPEGYLVISPDPAAVAALSKDSFAPEQATGWSRLRGKAFGLAWKAWAWSYFRVADLKAALGR